MNRVLINREIYEQVIQRHAIHAKDFLWIATADIKDMYIAYSGKMVPFLSVLEKLIRKKVAIRLIHAKEPGTNFRKDFDKYPLLWKNLERICCPRVHFKTVIIDGVTAYTGSANLTGAGMGAKKAERRNFENGILTDDPQLVDKLMRQFDDLWIGKDCKNCQRREFCVDRIDGL